MNPLRLAAGILVVSMVACGGGDKNDGSTTSGGAGAATVGTPAGGSSVAGSTATAGSPAAGGTNSAGGQSGSAGSSVAGGGSAAGGMPTGAHCTPGTPQPAASFIGGIVDQCSSVSGLTGDFNHLIDIQLPNPIGPGDTFAFSVDMKAPEGDFEVYGTTRECGDVGEKLSTVHVLGNGIICHAVKPVTGTYSHLIWVWRVRGEMLMVAMCESGTCPAQ